MSEPTGHFVLSIEDKSSAIADSQVSPFARQLQVAFLPFGYPHSEWRAHCKRMRTLAPSRASGAALDPCLPVRLKRSLMM